MFCPKCGRKDVVDVFCATCLREERPLVAGFKEFSLEICTDCGKVLHKGKWHEGATTESLVRDALVQHVVLSPNIDVERIEVAPLTIERKHGLKNTGEATVTVTGRASLNMPAYDEVYSFPYTVQNLHCPRCSKIGTPYFQGTLQVRNETPERVKFLKEYLKNVDSTPAKEEKQGSGHDYYLTSKTTVERAARALQEQFGGLVKSSARLFSRNHQTSKEIYRTTWFIELPPFKKGDALKREEAVLLIIELGKRVKCYNPARNKYEFHEYDAKDWTRLPVVESTISSTHPQLMVLHPETFQAVPVRNAMPRQHEIGDKVTVTADGDKVYLLETFKE